jgi:hypothetical protein
LKSIEDEVRVEGNEEEEISSNDMMKNVRFGVSIEKMKRELKKDRK